MSGEDVAKVFWEDKDLERIRRYCSNDVLTIGQFIMRFNNKDLLEPTQVEII